MAQHHRRCPGPKGGESVQPAGSADVGEGVRVPLCELAMVQTAQVSSARYGVYGKGSGQVVGGNQPNPGQHPEARGRPSGQVSCSVPALLECQFRFRRHGILLLIQDPEILEDRVMRATDSPSEHPSSETNRVHKHLMA